MNKAYSDWNNYLLRKFFYESHEGDAITLRVSREWFDRTAAQEGMGGYEDFVRCMSDRCDLMPWGGNDVCANLQAMIDRQRRCIGSEPMYLAYYALLCLPW